MAVQLTSLPAEIVQHIFSFVTVDDAERLLCLDFVRHVDPKILERKCAKHRHIQITHPNETPPIKGTKYKLCIDMLNDLRSNSGMLRYVKSLTVLKPMPDGTGKWTAKLIDLVPTLEELSDVTGGSSSANLAGHANRLLRAFRRKHVEKLDETPYPFEEFDDLFLLIANLPALERLSIPVPGTDIHRSVVASGALKKATASSYQLDTLPKVLGCIQSLTLRLLVQKENYRLNMAEVLCTFRVVNLLRGLEKIVVIGDGCRLFNEPLVHVKNLHPKSVKRLELYGCNVSPTMLQRFLDLFPKLQDLVFERDIRQSLHPEEHSTTPISEDPWLHPLTSLYPLLKDSSGPELPYPSFPDPSYDHLERLRIGFYHHEKDRAISHPGEWKQSPHGCMAVFQEWTLKNLRKLRVLDLSCHALCQPERTTILLTRLAYFLPGSLETLKVQNVPDEMAAASLMDGLQLYSNKLLKLTLVILSSPEPAVADYVDHHPYIGRIQLKFVGTDQEWMPF